jgi:antitoxin component YwqK of YwqJK toxin-antitoxin module
MNWLKLTAFSLITISIAACDSKKTDAGTGDTEKKETKYIPKETEYFPTGELKMAGKVKNGERVGPWASWFRNGQKNSEATYIKGKMDGKYKVWYENGQLRIEGQYKEDKETGTWYFYSEMGDTLKVQDFDKNQPVSVQTEKK